MYLVNVYFPHSMNLCFEMSALQVMILIGVTVYMYIYLQAQQISFAPGVQQNLLQGNMVLIKNERGQMVLLQNPGQPQQPSASNSPVIQSALPSQARVCHVATKLVEI